MKLLMIISVIVILHIDSIICNRQLKNEKNVFVTVSPPPSIGEPWPLPQSIQTSTTFYFIDEAIFQFQSKSYTCDILESAFERYRFLTFPSINDDNRLNRDMTLKFLPHWRFLKQKKPTQRNWCTFFNNFGGRCCCLRQQPLPPDLLKNKHQSIFYFNVKILNFGIRVGAPLDSLKVQLLNPCETVPSLNMDESYELVVDANGALLTSKSIWGALRGLETFSQIVYEDTFGVYQLNYTSISDFPRFSHRGTMLDTSRHYVTISVLKQNLDAMAQNKFNVFHWHIVDDPSFPYVSEIFPALSAQGAYTPAHIYTPSQIKDIVEYARLRGIRVIPEFDSPGHTLSWGNGQAGLLTKCYKNETVDGTFGPVDPSNSANFVFLNDFFKEVSAVFPDRYIHMGGDEVPFGCWQSNPSIQAFMKKMSFTSYAKLEQYYMQTLLTLISEMNKGYVIWQEVIDNGAVVQNDTVVEVWKDGYQDELAKVTKLGYRTLLSSCWYLNYISYGIDWPKYYACDPQEFNGTEEQKKLVMGGETCIWGEYVDSTNLIPRFWPRASAVGERLWSAQNVNNTQAATPRLEEHRCRMLRRGIPAQPQNGPGFCRYEVPPQP